MDYKKGFIRLHLLIPFHFIGGEGEEKKIDAGEVVWIQTNKILMITQINGKARIILDKNEILAKEAPEIVLNLLEKATS